MITKQCEQCGKDFKTKPDYPSRASQKRCSRKCLYKSLKKDGRKGKKYKKCRTCYSPLKYGKKNYCSKECDDIYQVEGLRECVFCKKEFYRHEGFGTTCSSNCYEKSRTVTKRKKCIICNKSFQVKITRKNKGQWVRRTCGKEECQLEHKRLIKQRQEIRDVQESNKKLHFVENEFSSVKEKYLERIIDYDQSPTGKAYIGYAKGVLTPNKNGIGFMGVKIQSENRELIQCNECGQWYKRVDTQHLKRHDITTEQYREKYGYNRTTALISDKLSNYYAANIINTKAMVQKQGKSKFMPRRSGWSHSLEFYNNKGTCPEQLKEKLVNYINRFHLIPSQSKKKGVRESFSAHTYIKRFGSFNNALKEYGLPTREKIGGVTTFMFADGTRFKCIHGKGYEQLYLIMKKKCPILSQFNGDN